MANALLRRLLVCVSFCFIYSLTLRYLQTNDAFPIQHETKGAVKVYALPSSNATVAICLIVRNETRYIEEWIDFHIALGFAPIYIYDNSLAPDIELALWYELREDIHDKVTIIHFPKAPVQLAAYDRCVKEDAKNNTFIALFDVDEFLVLRKHDNVVDFMEDHCNEECGQLSINWKMMGTSNETNYRPLTKYPC